MFCVAQAQTVGHPIVCKYPKNVLFSVLRAGIFFSLVECDIQVHVGLVDKFWGMSPLFIHVKLDEPILSHHMRSFVLDRNIVPIEVSEEKCQQKICRLTQIS